MSDKMSAVIAALMGDFPLPIRPYDTSSDVPRDIGLGGPSTEVLGTYDTPAGDFANVPQLWYLGNHGPFMVEDPIPFAHDYEVATGRTFPRYDDLNSAIMGAQYRSGAGGAEARSITDPRATLFQRKPIFGLGF